MGGQILARDKRRVQGNRDENDNAPHLSERMNC